MFVCICNGYRDRELRALAKQGVSRALTAYSALGHGPRCGRCLHTAQSIIDESHPDTATRYSHEIESSVSTKALDDAVRDPKAVAAE